MKNKRTELSELGEFGLIEHLTKDFPVLNESTKLGVGDDAAVFSLGKDLGLISTDMLVEGVHFDLSYVPLQHLGYKSVAVNVSDIAAMNGKAEQIMINLALSNRMSLEAIDALYAGIRSACEKYGVNLVGGDTSSSKSGLFLSLTVLGKGNENNIVKRSGASKGDIICATGDLGAAYVGLQILEREKQVFLANPEMQPDLEKYNYIVGRQLKPEARMDIIHELEELKVVPTSMIDISDGLASEVLHLSKHSGFGFRVYEDKLPIDKQTYDTAVELNLDPITCALNGGEDYELLFTIKQEDYSKLEKHDDIHFIGHVTEKGEVCDLVTKNKNIVSLSAQGFNHLK